MQALVIGDIHGCLPELTALIGAIPSDCTPYLVGDLIDRGPSSEAVIDYVRANSIACVRGNHEAMAIEALPLLREYIADPTPGARYYLGGTDWFYNGGHDVFNQYIANSSLEKLVSDIEWLATLPLFITTGIVDSDGLELLVSHTFTGKYRDLALVAALDPFDFVWSREQPDGAYETYYNIFGHTPTNYLTRLASPPEPIFHPTACNIDTGCCYPTTGRGVLTGVYFPSLSVIQINLGASHVTT